jgi:hypothetical protein
MSFIQFESISGVEHKINPSQITSINIDPREDKCILLGVNHKDARTLPNFEIRLACGKIIDRNTILETPPSTWIMLQESQYTCVRLEIEELIRKLNDL